MTDFTGELAALGTAMAFAGGSTLFTLAGRRVGSPLVNRTRLLIASVLVMILHTLTFGQVLPDASGHEWFWLGLSGIVGLALGDASLFQAFVMIGPRLSMLMMALAPVLSVVLAWVFLGETLSLVHLIGIGLTVGGIAWVVTERQSKAKNGSAMLADTPRAYVIGLLFGLGGALGQAGGLVLSKIGLDDGLDPLSGNLIRLSAALIVVWLFTALQGRLMSSLNRLRSDPKAVGLMSIASVFGPVLGVWLSLVAVQRAPVGIASTLMALTPIFLLPVGRFVFQERVSRQAVLGTLVAFVGTVMLFL